MKKILVMACSVIILAAIAISGTIAYFTDSDDATNVFTVGNVVIKLNEEQRDLDDNGNPVPNSDLEDFVDDKNLMPLVGELGSDEVNGLPTASNFVDKIVTVSNTGKSDAYVRVYVGVPAELDKAEPQKALHFVDGSDYNTKSGTSYKFTTNATDNVLNQTVNGVVYNFYCFTLDGALPDGDTTGAAIVGFYLDSAVDYDDGGENSENAAYYICDKSDPDNKLTFDLGSDDGVKIPVYVQAVQKAGFDNPATAFGTAFTQYPWGGSSSTTPSATPAPVPSAITPTTPPIDENGNCTISSAAELLGFANMVNNGTDFSGKTVTLTNDIVLSNQQQWTPIGQSQLNGLYFTPGNCFKGTFDGNGKTIYHLTFDKSKVTYDNFVAQGLFGYCEGTIQNLTLDGANITGVSWVGGIAGYLGSGSITNCKVNNSEIKSSVGESGDYGAIAGAIVGQAEEDAKLENCKANSCTVKGYKNAVGTIAGMAYNGKVDDDCIATNCKAYYRNGTNDAIYDGIVGKLESPEVS